MGWTGEWEAQAHLVRNKTGGARPRLGLSAATRLDRGRLPRPPAARQRGAPPRAAVPSPSSSDQPDNPMRLALLSPLIQFPSTKPQSSARINWFSWAQVAAGHQTLLSRPLSGPSSPGLRDLLPSFPSGELPSSLYSLRWATPTGDLLLPAREREHGWLVRRAPDKQGAIRDRDRKNPSKFSEIVSFLSFVLLCWS